MNEFRIPLSYTPIPIDEVTGVLESYKDRNHNDLVTDFERRVCEMVGANYAIALNSGTAAIHLGLKALKVGEGDIVLVSTFTYVASVNPIRYLGAIPFFIDSCIDDWNMDPDLLEAAIKKCNTEGKTPKVILVVHTFGMPAKMNEIKQVATRYQIPILEDAAEAIGSTYQTKHAGTLTDVGIFSFNNNKLFTTYGGGALITNDSEIAAKANLWAGQSRDNQPYYEHKEIGFNYKMSVLNAAAGLAQIESVQTNVNARREIFSRYRKLLGAKTGWQEEGSGCFSNRWITAIKLPKGVKRDDLQRLLNSKSIETRPVWKPMHLQPVFSNFQSSVNGCSEELFENGICLPSGKGLNEEQIFEISTLINNMT
jgi:dTDP-4-amino-4,6-dideoxygalactose transaminase